MPAVLQSALVSGWTELSVANAWELTSSAINKKGVAFTTLITRAPSLGVRRLGSFVESAPVFAPVFELLTFTGRGRHTEGR